MGTPGRTKSASTIHKETRKLLNHHAAAITEKLLAKALQGDTTALLACSNLLRDANSPPPPSK